MDSEKRILDESNRLWAKAQEIIPAGTQTFSKGPSQFVEGVTPKYLERGHGGHSWDVDGNRYIDFVMACHAIVLGYADQDVNRAIAEQLEKGIIFSLMHPLEVEVSERLIEIVPCAEAVRFGKNGADATSAAVRISRAVTGREHVAYCGYHGWHDWYIANTDMNRGVPLFNQSLVHAFTYNDLDSLTNIFEQYPDNISCVIMEPLTVVEPSKGFLESVKEVAHHYKALLVFDEIITGFRFAIGGAQELIGVVPDIACFAKGLCNGMPLSAVTGRKELMAVLSETFFSFTYGGECLSLAAAKANIDKFRRDAVVPHLWNIGQKLQEGYNKLAALYGLEEMTRCIGYPCRTVLFFDGRGKYNELELRSLFQQELIKRGILAPGYHAICYAHTEDDVDMALEAYEHAFRVLRRVLDSGHQVASKLEGPPIRPVFQRVADFWSYTKRVG